MLFLISVFLLSFSLEAKNIYEFSNENLEKDFIELSQEVSCPLCAGSSIAENRLRPRSLPAGAVPRNGAAKGRRPMRFGRHRRRVAVAEQLGAVDCCSSGNTCLTRPRTGLAVRDFAVSGL